MNQEIVSTKFGHFSAFSEDVLYQAFLLMMKIMLMMIMLKLYLDNETVHFPLHGFLENYTKKSSLRFCFIVTSISIKIK